MTQPRHRPPRPAAPCRRPARTLALAVVGVTATGGAAHADDARTRSAPGDTVSHIAARTGATVTAIARANAPRRRLAHPDRPGAHHPDDVAHGRRPRPRRAAPPQRRRDATRSPRATRSRAHRRAATAPPSQAIVAANGLDSRAFIRVGQMLDDPGRAAAAARRTGAPRHAAAVSAGGVTTRCGPGDTVSAHRRAATAPPSPAIVAANGLDSPRADPHRADADRSPAPTAATPARRRRRAARRQHLRRAHLPDSVVAAANANKATLLAVGVPSQGGHAGQDRRDRARDGRRPGARAGRRVPGVRASTTPSVSPANAIGTMQVIPTLGRVGVATSSVASSTCWTRTTTSSAGVAILRSLVKTAPDLPTAIAGYYQGASSVKRNGMFADTRRYVANVQTHMTRFALTRACRDRGSRDRRLPAVGATVTDPLVGRLVDGRYEVVSRIARGGMATVYLAVDRRLDRDVALKVMHAAPGRGHVGLGLRRPVPARGPHRGPADPPRPRRRATTRASTARPAT